MFFIEYTLNSVGIVWFLITVAEYFHFGNKILGYDGYLAYNGFIMYQIIKLTGRKEHQHNTRLLYELLTERQS